MVIRALLLKMFRQVDPEAQTQRVELAPASDSKVRNVMHANRWRASGVASEQARRTMIATIVERLLLSPPAFVAVHFDGDQPWARRASSTVNAAFSNQVVAPVRRVLAGHLDAAGVEKALARLLVVCPFYSIEAWTYQHTTLGAERCRARCGHHVGQFEAWATDRGALDEVDKPKATVCFGSEHNADLAGPGYPAEAVHAAEKSWRATVDRLRASTDLVVALAATHL